MYMYLLFWMVCSIYPLPPFFSVRLTTDFEQTRIAFVSVHVCVHCKQMLHKMNTKTACFMSIFLVDPIKIYITSIAIVLGLFSQQAEKIHYTLVGLVFILLYLVSLFARDICFVSCATKYKCFEMLVLVQILNLLPFTIIAYTAQFSIPLAVFSALV